MSGHINISIQKHLTAHTHAHIHTHTCISFQILIIAVLIEYHLKEILKKQSSFRKVSDTALNITVVGIKFAIFEDSLAASFLYKMRS